MNYVRAIGFKMIGVVQDAFLQFEREDKATVFIQENNVGSRDVHIKINSNMNTSSSLYGVESVTVDYYLP